MPGTHSVAACPGDGKRRLPCIRRLLDQLVDLDDRKQHGQYDHEDNAASNQDQNGLRRKSLSRFYVPLPATISRRRTPAFAAICRWPRHWPWCERAPAASCWHPGTRAYGALSHTPPGVSHTPTCASVQRVGTGFQGVDRRHTTAAGNWTWEKLRGHKADDRCTAGRPSLLETRLLAQA